MSDLTAAQRATLERSDAKTSEASAPSVNPRGDGSDAGCDGIRTRVLALLERHRVGTHENWRDSDPGYWIGVAEGEAATEHELEIERAKSEANQMAYRSYRRERDEAWEILRDLEWAVAICGPNDTWDCCPECNEAEPVGHAEDCRLAAVLCAADPKRLSR